MISKNERHFLNFNQIHPKLLCYLCKQVFYEPVVIPCGHSFCKTCIYYEMYISGSCPSCKSPADFLQPIFNTILAQIVNGLEVKCNHSQCRWTGMLYELYAHKQYCTIKVKRTKLPKSSNSFPSQTEELPSSCKHLNFVTSRSFQNQKNQTFNFQPLQKLQNQLTLVDCVQTPRTSDKRYHEVSEERYQHFSDESDDSECGQSQGLILDKDQDEQIHSDAFGLPKIQRHVTQSKSTSKSQKRESDQEGKNKGDQKRIQEKLQTAKNKNWQNYTNLNKRHIIKEKNKSPKRNSKNHQNSDRNRSRSRNRQSLNTNIQEQGRVRGIFHQPYLMKFMPSDKEKQSDRDKKP